MTNYTNEQLISEIDLFPGSIRHMLFSADTERKVQKIGVDSGLLIDQLKIVNIITNDAILGLLIGRNIEAEIKNSLELTEAQSKEIAEKISAEIVDPINDLKVKLLVEQREKAERDRIDKETEERWDAEEAEELAEAERAMAEDGMSNIEVEEESTETLNPSPSRLQPTNDDLHPNPYDLQPSPARIWKKAPDVAPDNLPTGEQGESESRKSKVESGEKAGEDTKPLNAFEAKMKKVFTGSIPANDELVLETPTPAKILTGQTVPFDPLNTPSLPPSVVVNTPGQLSNVPLVAATTQDLKPITPHRNDPYREAIE